MDLFGRKSLQLFDSGFWRFFSSSTRDFQLAFLSVLKRRLVCLNFFQLGILKYYSFLFCFVGSFQFETEKWSKWFPSAFDFRLECQVTPSGFDFRLLFQILSGVELWMQNRFCLVLMLKTPKC
ncbi:hypothetical protein C1646_672981 [Rhizophagus diaphanus]|nr:hypothetical protein C1646_672981 [Rhizophagus diaphanus] [Rhizophagus sp. MUCL 43196]